MKLRYLMRDCEKVLQGIKYCGVVGADVWVDVDLNALPVVEEPKTRPHIPQAVWDVLPDECMCVVRTESGGVFAMGKDAKLKSLFWESSGFVVSITRLKGVTPGTCDWKDSLVRRPEERLVSLKDWEKVPSELNYLAVDKDGELWGYQNCPEVKLEDAEWDARGAVVGLNYLNMSFGDRDWRDTLEVRPGYEGAES